MNAAHQRQLTPVLGGIVVVLAALLLLLLGGVGRGVHWAPPRALPPLPPAASGASLPPPQPLQQFALVWQKPLFNADRKPVAHAAEGGSSLGDLELTGVIVTPGLRMALLHDRNGNRELRLHEGESLPDGSVTLVEVQPRSAVFDSAAGRTELKLPAGAPIDQVKPGGNGRNIPPPVPGNAMMRLQPGGPGQPRPDGGAGQRPQPATPAASEQPAQSALERLRRTIEKRRAERAAASPAGEH